MPQVARPANRSQAPAVYPDPIPGIISHGSLNVLAGASGVGKTCLLSWILTRLRDGQPLFGHPIHAPAALGYICADRSYQGAKYWLSKAGYLDIPFYSLVDDPTFNTQLLRSKLQHTKILESCFDKLALPPGSLVVVDPLALFMGGNLNDYMSCAIACLEIRKACKKRELTLIGTAHAGKQKADKKERYQRLQDRILGSSAQLGYGDTQLYLASPDETGERHYTFMWHPHTAPAATFPLGRDESGMFVPWEASQDARAVQTILDMIPTDGSVVTLAALQGLCSDISRATLFRRLKELLEDGRLEKPAEGQYRRAAVN